MSKKNACVLRELRRSAKLLRPTDDDAFLLRFARARKFELAPTLAMLQEYLNWREQYKPDLLNPCAFRQRVDSCQAFIIGNDKQGHPTLVVMPARFVPSLNSPEIAVQYVVWVIDCLTSRLEAPTETFSIIIDLTGLSPRNMSFPFIRSVIHVLQNYNPERLHRLFLVNAPFFFKAASAVVSRLLAPETAAKIVLGHPADLWQHWDRAAVPDTLGGILRRYPRPGDAFESILAHYVSAEKVQEYLRTASQAPVAGLGSLPGTADPAHDMRLAAEFDARLGAGGADGGDAPGGFAHNDEENVDG